MNKDKLEKRVWFPGYARALAQEPWPQGQREMCRGILARSLHECQERRWPVCVTSAPRFMEELERERQPSTERLAVVEAGAEAKARLPTVHGMRNSFLTGRDGKTVRSRSWPLSARLLPAMQQVVQPAHVPRLDRLAIAPAASVSAR
jgi:hypothetical protein